MFCILEDVNAGSGISSEPLNSCERGLWGFIKQRFDREDIGISKCSASKLMGVFNCARSVTRVCGLLVSSRASILGPGRSLGEYKTYKSSRFGSSISSRETMEGP